jgi:hypothetical protein
MGDARFLPRVANREVVWIKVVGEITTDISNEEIWTFFSQHTLD